MRIITKKRLKEAWQKYPDAESFLQAWAKLVEAQGWNSFNELKNTSIFAPDQVKNFVLFDIGGNKYRLITDIDYEDKIIFIRDFLTHIEYDKGKWKNDD
ncbi:MAG: type II toxin-antitoxin system HigB family toxin [Scytonematopsis contorta HA4267-MV1]|jgi:mRNA interferase HigB|nr:type II toxin-antitoxin system HigB family toxin [Scytonematopsis contorta HA4267-MV1]